MQKGITDISFVGENVAHRVSPPCVEAEPFWGTHLVEHIGDGFLPHAGEVAHKNKAHDLGLLFHDVELPILQHITVRGCTGDEGTILHAPFDAPSHVFGDGYGFFLGLRSRQCQQHFAGHIRSVNVLFLEENGDTVVFEQSGIQQGVRCVSCEATDGLGQDSVDLSFLTIGHQSIEVLSLCSLGSADAFVGVDVHQLHTLVIADEVGVVLYLSGEGVKLVAGVAGHTAVGSHTEDKSFLHTGRYGDDLVLHFAVLLS